MAVPHLRAEPIRTSRLLLEPLRVEHADEAAAAFDDEALHAWTGGVPAGADELRRRYERQVAGRSDDGAQTWLNWMLRREDTGQLVGTVQATVGRAADGVPAEVAWVVATGHQRQGYAGEAALAMAAWLRRNGVPVLIAHVHPGHRASMGVARALGMQPTGTVVDGEVRWGTQDGP